MILVDSCVWIDLLGKRGTREVRFLQELLLRPRAEICLSHVIYFEVLRGIPNTLERRRIQRIFDRLEFFDYRNSSFVPLIDLVLECRRNGFTLPKLGDWLILKTVLDHSLSLLTSDKHFISLQRFVPFPLAS